MSLPGTVVVRRTWPQRLVILCCVGVIAGAVVASWILGDVYDSVTQFGRVPISGEILVTETEPGEPVNFLLIGEDSALGLDADDPVLDGREFDPDLRFFADSITMLRVVPETGQAWVLSLPRDLLVDRGGQKKINSVYFVEGPAGLIETITDNFGITINHYLSLDFLGFRRVVDELDGVPVWFDNPARDINTDGEAASGLRIETAGCHVLDGVQALQYVRSRGYQEMIEGEWEYVGRRDDFGRIQRQQDFLVLALERAIDRGARAAGDLASLISSAANSMRLDSQLTVAELVDVGKAFSEFDPESLQRLDLQVTNEGTGLDYKGEVLVEGVNEASFAVFRGVEQVPSPSQVDLAVYGGDSLDIGGVAAEIENQGFTVTGRFVHAEVEEDSVVVYPTGRLAAAESVARYLEPIPRLVEDPDAAEISLVLGSDHDQVLFLFAHEVAKMRAAVRAFGVGEVPDLSLATEVPAATGSTTTAATPTTAAPVTTTVAGVESDAGESAVTTTTSGIIGRAPEGQSCG